MATHEVLNQSVPLEGHDAARLDVALLEGVRREGGAAHLSHLHEIGVRVPDVVWASAEFMHRHGAESEFRAGPDLCVEVLSPTNTRAEIGEKIAAYLEAGAREVWVVGDDGVPEIHTSAGRATASTLGFVLPRAPQA